MDKKKVQSYMPDLLERMVKVYSPSGQEAQLAKLLFDELGKNGFGVRQDEVGNVIGTYAAGRPRVLFCGHMDTVPGRIRICRDGDLLYGRGTVDAKGPLAALVAAASELVNSEYCGSIVVVGTVEEEGTGVGVKNLFKQGLGVDYAVFGEPTNTTTVTVGYKGNLSLRVMCQTSTGHSSAPWLFENAVEHAFKINDMIKENTSLDTSTKDNYNSLTSCITQIRGGGRGSTVPSRCSFRVDIRIPPSLTVQETKDMILKWISNYQSSNPKVRIDVLEEDSTEPYVADRKSLLVKAFSQTIWKKKGTTVKLISKTGTSDMNLFGHAYGIPSIAYGPGDPHLDHTEHEHLSIKAYLESIEILQEALRRLCILHNMPTKAESS